MELVVRVRAGFKPAARKKREREPAALRFRGRLEAVTCPMMSADPQTDATPWTIERLLSWTTKYLDQRGVADARLATEVLLAHAVGCRRIDLYARFERQLEGQPLSRFRGWVRRAAEQEPIAYLVEEKEFFSLPFRVTPDVLIPRPETELLVEQAVDHCRKRGLSHPHLLDLGTGSGCMAVTLLVQLEGAVAVATDISPAAIEVARANADRHQVSDRLTLVTADRLALPEGTAPERGFDLVVSNPPYVASGEVSGLEASVRDHEPAVALTDGGDGLSFYRSIGDDASAFLDSDGVVFVEVGDGMAASVVETIEAAGSLVHQRTWRDRVVGQDRVLMFSPAPSR